MPGYSVRRLGPVVGVTLGIAVLAGVWTVRQVRLAYLLLCCSLAQVILQLQKAAEFRDIACCWHFMVLSAMRISRIKFTLHYMLGLPGAFMRSVASCCGATSSCTG